MSQGKKNIKKDISEDEFENIPMINLLSFDLEEYIAQYTSPTNKIRRLLFISQATPELEEKALQLAIEELKVIYDQYGTMDFNCFTFIHNKLNIPLDKATVEQMEKKSTLKLEKLTNELNNSRNSQIRESIRIGTNELGDFYAAQGDIESALKTYYKLKENCTSPLNVIDMCFKIIKIYASNLKISSAINYIAKAEKTSNISSTIMGQIQCAHALVFLEENKYKTAAHFFIASSESEIFNSFSDVISASDIAIYASLCALATFDRIDLKTNVLNHKMFKGLLELVPPIRELLLDFYHSRYSSAVKSLDQIIKYLRNDMYLSGHIDQLMERIKNNSLVQYCKPFISISLAEMGLAFNTSVQLIEKDLLALIISGHIKARIDSHNKILYAHDKDQRALTFERALKMGEIHLRNTKAFVLRSNFILNDVAVSSDSSSSSSSSSGHPLLSHHMRPMLNGPKSKQKQTSRIRADNRPRPRV